MRKLLNEALDRISLLICSIVNRKGMVRKAFVFQQRCYCLRFPMSRDDEAGSKPGLTKSRNY